MGWSGCCGRSACRRRGRDAGEIAKQRYFGSDSGSPDLTACFFRRLSGPDRAVCSRRRDERSFRAHDNTMSNKWKRTYSFYRIADFPDS
jgi:hypothetical protein